MSVRFAAVSNHTEEHIRVYEKNGGEREDDE